MRKLVNPVKIAPEHYLLKLEYTAIPFLGIEEKFINIAAVFVTCPNWKLHDYLPTEEWI